MAKQEVGLKIDVDVSSVGNIKKELRAATNELVAMNEKFGSASKEAVAAAQKVAGLKDAIGDAKALAETFNPDKKFVALGGAVQGAAAGFSALQGAMGLFGAESKEVEQMLLKVQSAMALQQGISGIANAMDSFKLLAGQIATSSFALKANAVATNLASGAMKLFGVSVATTSNAFRVLKGAIIATGIGALIVIVGELVNVLMDVADSSDEAAAAQKRLEKAQKDAADAIELQNKMLEGQIDLSKRNTDLAVNRAKATGASEEEITKLTRDGILKRQKLLKDDLEQRGIGTDQFYEKLKEFSKVNNELEDFDLNQQIKRREKSDADREKRIAKDDEKAKKRKEDAQKLAEDRAQEQKDINALIQKELDDQFAIDEAKRIENENEIKESNERIFQSQLEAAQKRAELQKNFNAESIAADIALQDAKFEAASAGLNALSTLAGDNEKLANVLFAIDKGLAIAKIIVDTQREIGGYFAANAVFGLPGAALAAKQSLAAKIRAGASIATIVATSIAKFKKGGGSAGADAGGGGGNLTAPVAPQLSPQVTATQVNTAAVNQLGNQATRAYVLNSDIQNNDQRNAYINRNASIGNP
jgi:hypothetical protein